MRNISTHLNCLQICLFNICQKYELTDYLMFTDAWKFSHDNKKQLSQSLSIPWESDHNNMQNLQGLFFEIIAIDGTNNLFMLDVLKKEVGKIDILMYINSYECPWHKGFKKLNIPHYVQIVDIDYEKEVIICDDPYLIYYKMELPFAHYLSGCKTIRKFHINSCENRRINDEKILSHISERTNIQQITSDITSFAKRLLIVNTKEELFDYMDDVYLCSNVRNLKFIADSRYGLSYLFDSLNSISDKSSDLLELAKRFEFCGSLFEKINHFYIKLYFRGSDLQMKLQSIHDKLIEIANTENEIFNLLNQVTKS